MSPAGVFLVAFSLCSRAVLEQVVADQALMTVSPVYSANLVSTTPPTLSTSKIKNIWSSEMFVSHGDLAKIEQPITLMHPAGC